MAHYAKIENDIVVQVIKADYDFKSKLDGEWVRTSYNTHGGVHKRGNIPLRLNYAGVGYTYNRDIDGFIPPKPYNSWLLNTTTGQWHAPLGMPLDGSEYKWNEKELKWDIMQK